MHPPDWPFDQAPNVAAITTIAVVEGRLPVLLVHHDAEDHSWSFLCGTTDDDRDVRIVGMGEALEIDPSLREVGDLPPGWIARRATVGGAWTRSHDPAQKHWCSLVDRVHETADGFHGLSPEEQKFFAVSLLRTEVFNGGFDQYFWNSSGDFYAQAVEGLMEMGATESLRLSIEAKELLFGASAVARSEDARRAVLRRADDSSPRLKELDKAFCKEPDRIEERLEKFARDHALRRDF